MGDTSAWVSVNMSVRAETEMRVQAFEAPRDRHGRASVVIQVGVADVAMVVTNVAALDRLMDTIADARTALLRVTRESDVRQPELLAS